LARPLRLEYPGAIWHVTQRGNERKDIYRSDLDRRRFLELLVRSIEIYQWIVHAFVLMTNHYHLLIETPIPNLSRGMRDLDGDYAEEFNRRHRRSGHLFQGRFKGFIVEKETYLLRLCRYVVLNPVRARMVESVADWPWSSYRATALLEPPTPWLEVDWTLRHFGLDRREAARRYRQYVAEGVGLERSPWEDLKSDLYLGSEAFGEQLKSLLGERELSTEFPRPHRQAVLPDLDSIRNLVVTTLGVRPETLRQRGRSDARLAFAWLARRAAASSCRQIQEQLALSAPGVSHLLRLTEERLRTDKQFARLVDDIKRALKSPV
jgi:putative transposase